MTRVILAAGVAALAIAVPASAGPHNGKGGGQAEVRAAAGAARAQAVERRGGGGVAAPRAQRAERIQQFAAPRIERAQRFAAIERPQRAERVQMRAERQATPRIDRVQARAVERQQARVAPIERQARIADRQQLRANRVQQARVAPMERQARVADRQQLRANRMQQVQAQGAQRQQLRTERAQQVQSRMAQRQQVLTNRVAMTENRLVQRPMLRPDRVARIQALAANRALVQPVTTYGTRVLPMTTAQTFVGVPITTAATVLTLSPLPQTVQYLYPDTPDYYYRYGDGYLYQVDRGSNLIAALLPLLMGGYMPGQYLPQPYMSSYVPDYYGLNSFYPSSYDYGYGYDSSYSNTCNRYVNGVIYQVDCISGMIEDVVPMYAGGYGVGQMLPSAYTTYNVPYQYRSMYYDTPDYGYYYAPGAIYQYDQGSSLITSVAALLSPGFSVGQPLPMGYDAYNVPYGYRQTYYDTPDAWYRYNNGNIYQVDPTTQLVTAIVASLLT
jgi:hypothetical protein